MKTNMSGWMAALAVFSLLGVGTRAMAQVWTAGGGTDRNWTNPANWHTGVIPTSGSDATLGHASYSKIADAEITVSGAVARWLSLGGQSATVGTVTMVSGDLTVARLNVGYSANALGRFVQNNGTVNVTESFGVGHPAGSDGIYELHDGILNVPGGSIGVFGEGAFVLHNGSFNVTAGDLVIGNIADSYGSVTMYDGNLLSAQGSPYLMRVGNNGDGDFRQYGGTNIVGHTLFIGSHASSTGRYDLVGGELVVTNIMYMNNGTSSFNQTNGTVVTIGNYLYIGNGGTSHAVYTMQGGTLSIANRFYMLTSHAAADLGGHSELRGWGTVTASGAGLFYKYGGIVRADGFGEDRELLFDIPHPGIASTNSTGVHGWYAQDGGKLTLRPVTINVTTHYWGDNATAGLNEVNAVRIDVTGRSGAGTLTGSLLAPDRGDVPAHNGTRKLAGVWQFSHSDFTFTTASMTFRYDPAAVTALGLAESQLQVYTHNGGNWQTIDEATITRDEANNRITATGIGDIDQIFAVGLLLPPRGTLISIR